jgi:hypothetical protein
MAVMVKQTRESTNDKYTIDWWILACFFAFELVLGVVRSSPIYRGRRSSGGDSGSTSDCCDKNTNSSEHKRQN